jgi:hypothetical protein
VKFLAIHDWSKYDQSRQLANHASHNANQASHNANQLGTAKAHSEAAHAHQVAAHAHVAAAQDSHHSFFAASAKHIDQRNVHNAEAHKHNQVATAVGRTTKRPPAVTANFPARL